MTASTNGAVIHATTWAACTQTRGSHSFAKVHKSTRARQACLPNHLLASTAAAHAIQRTCSKKATSRDSMLSGCAEHDRMSTNIEVEAAPSTTHARAPMRERMTAARGHAVSCTASRTCRLGTRPEHVRGVRSHLPRARHRNAANSGHEKIAHLLASGQSPARMPLSSGGNSASHTHSLHGRLLFS